jgi:hypothetical protein
MEPLLEMSEMPAPIEQYFKRELYDRFLELMNEAHLSGFAVVKVIFVDNRVDSLRIEFMIK